MPKTAELRVRYELHHDQLEETYEIRRVQTVGVFDTRDAAREHMLATTEARTLGDGLPLVSLADALKVARRATFDPGVFTKRVRYRDDEEETLERWQARAVLVALSATEPDDRWSNAHPHITEYERDELERVGLLEGANDA